MTKRYNSLDIENPILASQAFGWDPRTVTAGSNKRLQWKCSDGHTWGATVALRNAGSNCPHCLGRLPIIGKTDLATTHPEIAAQMYQGDPTSVSYGSDKRFLWICPICSHIWNASVCGRTIKNSRCSRCSSIATTHPELAAQAHGWDPTTLKSCSNKKVAWMCEEGHVWPSTPNNRSSGKGCPYCSGLKAISGISDLATVFPDIAAQANGWDPTLVSSRSNCKMKWRCENDHLWEASVNNRSKGDGCPYCSGHKIWIGFNDLATVNPELAREAHGWDPTTVTAHSNRRVEWICEFGHFWKAAVSNRSNGSGCSVCHPGGFNSNQPGYLYFLRHELWGMLQIGITNNPEQRTNQHGKRGWEILEIMGPQDGRKIRNYETEILRFLRRSGADIGNKDIAGKFNGYTEAWVKESYPVGSLKELLSLID